MSSIYKEKTSLIYGNLFAGYSDKLFEDSVDLFFKRHRVWNIDLDWFKNKVCLDVGCGGGRYLVALARLGVKKVVGIDVSKPAVDLSNQRLKERVISNALAQEGSVLDLPFPDAGFDYVISSGVIHHTPDPLKAFNELVRVLNPGGKMFLSVYGRGGFKWLVNDLFRYSICRIIPFKVVESIFSFFGIPANKRYNILDNLYVPYCYRFLESEIRRWFSESGFENIRRVKFERYDYETLKSRIIHGEGWIQIYADKKQ
ncbi:MAG: methyltransferase domain-containing protein [Minisyncoccia bacterium]